MKTQYLIRLDDACPTMSREKWAHAEEILDRYGIRPMVGIVPNNEDENLMRDPDDEHFWEKARAWEEKGWAIALHGYNHCYSSNSAGINPFWNRSEFAGVPLEQQKEKIRNGIAIMQKHGFSPKYFFAPSHTYDNHTIEALKSESDIRVISDSIGTSPYLYKGFVFIPQIIGHCTVPPISGIWTFCLHPNTMTEKNFKEMEEFVKTHKDEFISFQSLDIDHCSTKSIKDSMLSFMFFSYRRIRGLR